MTEYLYRIFDRETEQQKGAYSRAYRTEYDFKSPIHARTSMFNNRYIDTDKYRVDRYKILLDSKDVE